TLAAAKQGGTPADIAKAQAQVDADQATIADLTNKIAASTKQMAQVQANFSALSSQIVASVDALRKAQQNDSVLDELGSAQLKRVFQQMENLAAELQREGINQAAFEAGLKEDKKRQQIEATAKQLNELLGSTEPVVPATALSNGATSAPGDSSPRLKIPV